MTIKEETQLKKFGDPYSSKATVVLNQTYKRITLDADTLSQLTEKFKSPFFKFKKLIKLTTNWALQFKTESGKKVTVLFPKTQDGSVVVLIDRRESYVIIGQFVMEIEEILGQLNKGLSKLEQEQREETERTLAAPVSGMT